MRKALKRMNKYLESNKVINSSVKLYFDEMVKNFSSVDVLFETRNIIDHLMKYTFISICGALENKVRVCKYYLSSINYEYGYYMKKNNIYNHKDLYDFFKDIIKYFDLNDREMSVLDWDSRKSIFQNIKNHMIEECDNESHVYNYFKNIMFLNDQKFRERDSDIIFYKYNKQELDIYFNDALKKDICLSEANKYYADVTEETVYNQIMYDNLWNYRHSIAHNLNSYNLPSFLAHSNSIHINNYYFKVSLLIMIDNVIIDLMKTIIRLNCEIE